MSVPEYESKLDDQIAQTAKTLGKTVLGRDLTIEEADAMITIFKSSAQALKHGFIRRLAEHVVAERVDESIEEFFEGAIDPT